jgi:membrane protein YqaA with SNARE-associated domain
MNWWVAGIALGLFVWAFAEAYIWPVVPDAALASAVFLVPEGIEWFAGATVAGSAVGGATAMAAYRRGMRWPLPLVTPRMRSKVATWLDRGAVGLVYQPLTTVPYKVFVVEGAGRALGLAIWTLWTVVFRGARMSVVAVLAVLASGLVDVIAPIASARLALLGVGLALFLMGWRAAWQFWARSEDPESVHPDGMAPTFARTMRP